MVDDGGFVPDFVPCFAAMVCSDVVPFSAAVLFWSFELEPDNDSPGNPVVGKRELVGSVPAVRRYSGV
jgi:hypothetical protein